MGCIALLVVAASSGFALVRWVMSAGASDTTKVTVLDDGFRQVRAISSQRELAMFDELWSRRVSAAPETTPKYAYKLDIVRNGRSVRWLYDPAGQTTVLTIHRSRVYQVPSVDEFNALLALPRRPDRSP
jgi:hypothetical protein